ncbi:hypothetical protein QE152_g34149 [Popillia japonica]|uniref:Uncharacterized protein n=1 Tax=Popillia japonica TaxID=7064 RepID=A0AAW1IUP5_POPJA
MIDSTDRDGEDVNGICLMRDAEFAFVLEIAAVTGKELVLGVDSNCGTKFGLARGLGSVTKTGFVGEQLLVQSLDLRVDWDQLQKQDLSANNFELFLLELPVYLSHKIEENLVP